jgi:hypothetical protein
VGATVTADYAAVRPVHTGAAALATIGCNMPVAVTKSPLGAFARL